MYQLGQLAATSKESHTLSAQAQQLRDSCSWASGRESNRNTEQPSLLSLALTRTRLCAVEQTYLVATSLGPFVCVTASLHHLGTHKNKREVGPSQPSAVLSIVFFFYLVVEE